MRRWLVLLPCLAVLGGCEADDLGQIEAGTSDQLDEAVTPTEIGDLENQIGGTIPDRTMVIPDFEATNFDDDLRDQDSILGQRTVLWFFPVNTDC